MELNWWMNRSIVGSIFDNNIHITAYVAGTEPVARLNINELNGVSICTAKWNGALPFWMCACVCICVHKCVCFSVVHFYQNLLTCDIFHLVAWYFINDVTSPSQIHWIAYYDSLIDWFDMFISAAYQLILYHVSIDEVAASSMHINKKKSEQT